MKHRKYRCDTCGFKFNTFNELLAGVPCGSCGKGRYDFIDPRVGECYRGGGAAS